MLKKWKGWKHKKSVKFRNTQFQKVKKVKLLWRWIWLLRKCTIVGHRSQSTKIAVPHRYLEDSIFIHKARHHIYPIMELIWVNDALPFCIWLNFPPRHFSKHPHTNKDTWPHFMFLMCESILRSCFQYLHCNGFECHLLNLD